jgi:hypothetical protein
MSSICYSCQILMKIEFCQRLSKNNRISNFMKIRPVGAELLHADGRKDVQTDMTKLMIAFRSFVNAPKNPSAHDRKFY